MQLLYAGCVVPELLSQTKNIPWFQAGATIFDNKGIQYLGVPGLINAKSIIATLLVQVVLAQYPCPGTSSNSIE